MELESYPLPASHKSSIRRYLDIVTDVTWFPQNMSAAPTLIRDFNASLIFGCDPISKIMDPFARLRALQNGLQSARSCDKDLDSKMVLHWYSNTLNNKECYLKTVRPIFLYIREECNGL